MNIRLSPKYGLNPSMSMCFLCGGEKNEIILPGLLKDDREAPKQAIWNKEPCEKCKSILDVGVMFIEVRDDESGNEPFRTGKIVGIREEAVFRMVPGYNLKERICYIEESTLKKMLGDLYDVITKEE